MPSFTELPSTSHTNCVTLPPMRTATRMTTYVGDCIQTCTALSLSGDSSSGSSRGAVGFFLRLPFIFVGREAMFSTAVAVQSSAAIKSKAASTGGSALNSTFDMSPFLQARRGCGVCVCAINTTGLPPSDCGTTRISTAWVDVLQEHTQLERSKGI